MNFFVTILTIGLIFGKVRADYMEETWEDPNAWGRHLPTDSGPNVCPVCDVTEDGGLAAFYYKKLVANLFNKNTLKKNEFTGQLERAILFTVSEAQFNIIEKSTDIRDLDAAITDVLKAAKVVTGTGSTKGSGTISWLFNDILTSHFQIFWLNSEIRFICFITGIIMLIWFIHKRYNKSLIAVVTVAFFMFGYFFTYLECNRKLEADKFVKYVQENEEPPSNWFNNLMNSIFRKSKTDEKINEIQAQSKVQLPFCRPDSVLLMYINDMFLNQLELIINRCMSMSQTFKDSLSFPYNIVAMLCVPLLFFFITKLFFKYILSPRAWLHIFWDTHTSGTHQPQQQQSLNDSNEDRITGSNLQLLLQAFAKHNSQKEPLPSGVEEVLECLENGSAGSKSDVSKNEDDIEDNSINLDKISQDKVKKDS